MADWVDWEKMYGPVEKPQEAGMRPIPKTWQQFVIDRIQRNIPWDKVRDEITIPAINKAKETSKENLNDMEDKINSFMLNLTNPKGLIDESITNHLRKF